MQGLPWTATQGMPQRKRTQLSWALEYLKKFGWCEEKHGVGKGVFHGSELSSQPGVVKGHRG